MRLHFQVVDAGVSVQIFIFLISWSAVDYSTNGRTRDDETLVILIISRSSHQLVTFLIIIPIAYTFHDRIGLHTGPSTATSQCMSDPHYRVLCRSYGTPDLGSTPHNVHNGVPYDQAAWPSPPPLFCTTELKCWIEGSARRRRLRRPSEQL